MTPRTASILPVLHRVVAEPVNEVDHRDPNAESTLACTSPRHREPGCVPEPLTQRCITTRSLDNTALVLKARGVRAMMRSGSQNWPQAFQKPGS